MRKAAQIGLTILGGGLALGALLGAYAEPEMKGAPEPALQLSGRPAIEPGPVQHFVSLPEDLNPYGGYRPDLDYAAEITDWSPQYPSWTSGDLEEQEFAGFEEEPAYSGEPPPLERDAAEAIPAVAERAQRSLESAPSTSHKGHRIARVQADGLW